MFKLGGNFVLIWLHCCHFNSLVSFDFFVTGQSLSLLESGPGQGNCMQLCEVRMLVKRTLPLAGFCNL